MAIRTFVPACLSIAAYSTTICSYMLMNMLARQTTSAKLSSLSWTRTMQQAKTARPTGGGPRSASHGPRQGCGTVGGLPGAAAHSPQGSSSRGLPGIAPKASLCLCASVVRSVVSGYNYQLIVITNRHRFPKSSPPEKLPIPEASASCHQARPASRPPRWQAHTCTRARAGAA